MHMYLEKYLLFFEVFLKTMFPLALLWADVSAVVLKFGILAAIMINCMYMHLIIVYAVYAWLW